MADSKRTTVITFRGTVAEFATFLASWSTAAHDDWEVTACIARHPAGKGLRPADPPPDGPSVVERLRGCTCPAHEYAVAGHRASCPLGGAG